jgi:hypothetical protein
MSLKAPTPNDLRGKVLAAFRPIISAWVRACLGWLVKRP